MQVYNGNNCSNQKISIENDFPGNNAGKERGITEIVIDTTLCEFDVTEL